MQSGSSSSLPWGGMGSVTSGGANTLPYTGLINQFRELARSNTVALDTTIVRRIATELLGEELVTMMVLMDPKADEKLFAFCERLRAMGYGEGYQAGKADGIAAAARAPAKIPYNPMTPPWTKKIRPLDDGAWVRFKATYSSMTLPQAFNG